MSEYVDCRTCKTDCVRADGNYGYTFCDKYTHPHMTNADRIRAMSDEELVEFIKNIKVRAAFCKAVKDNDAFEALCSAEWLQIPTEEDNHKTN